MFSVASVCHSVLREKGSHVTIAHDALDLTVRPPAHSPFVQGPCTEPSPNLASWWYASYLNIFLLLFM